MTGNYKETLFVCDLDGTILDRNSRLLPRTADVFGHLLVDPDLHFTFATARSVKSALAVIPELQPERPLISYNGAFVTDPQSGEVLQENCFSPADVIYLSYLILTCGAAPFVYALSPAGKETITWELGRETPGMRYFLDQRRGDPRFRPIRQPWSEQVIEERMDEKERLEPFYQLVCQDERFSTVFQQEIYRPEYWLFIQAKEANKGQAARFVRNYLGLERIVAFGDSPNDLALFEVADEAYAVDNAVPALKERAQAVLPGNHEPGVAEFLLQILGLNSEG
jgi:HAD superfamily hydrolase (TIGR01484 family)